MFVGHYQGTVCLKRLSCSNSTLKCVFYDIEVTFDMNQ